MSEENSNGDVTFSSLFGGKLAGVMNLEDYNKRAESLKGGQWWAIEFGGGKAPAGPLSGEEAGSYLKERQKEIEGLNLLGAKYPYTYIAHINDEPAMIKLYHPLKSGGCGDREAPDPWWIFTTILPVDGELESLSNK